MSNWIDTITNPFTSAMSNLSNTSQLHHKLDELHKSARSLSEAGQYEEALAAYLTEFEESRSCSGWGVARLPFVVSGLERLGKHYQPAAAQLVHLRDEREQSMLEGKTTNRMVHEWKLLNSHISPERTMQFYDKLKTNYELHVKTIRIIKSVCWHQLVAHKLHHEYTEHDFTHAHSVPVHMTPVKKKIHQNLGNPEHQAAHELERQMLLQDCDIMFENSLISGNEKVAAQTAKFVLEYERSGETYARLIEAAVRASNTQWARKLTAEAKSSLPPEDLNHVLRAEQRIKS